MATFEYPRLVFSDPEGKIFDHPRLQLAGRSGDRMNLPHPSELVPLPAGSQLFTMPGRIPIGWDPEEGSFVAAEKVKVEGKEIPCH
ncbi:MAG: radical SAM protein, partial [Deltaproteobacteria bacterium]